jgi:hypothetical protein
MQTNSYDDWMRRPLSSVVCPTPDIWPDVRPMSLTGWPGAEPGARHAVIVEAAPSRRRSSVFAPDTSPFRGLREETRMNEGKARILKMLEEKKITAEQAMRLLDALDRTESRPSERDLKRKWLHIRVEKDGRQTVNIKLPLALLKFGFKFAPKHAHRKHVHAEAMAERAKARAERAREHAERARARMESRLREKFGDEAEVNLNGVFDEVFGDLEEELASAAGRHRHGNGVQAALDGIFNGDSDLDLNKILEMAQDPDFDGKILDVYDDDDDEHVMISLE